MEHVHLFNFYMTQLCYSIAVALWDFILFPVFNFLPNINSPKTTTKFLQKLDSQLSIFL